MSQTVLEKTAISSKQTRGRILAIIPVLPTSLGKSAHMLMLRGLSELGWQIVVLTLSRSKGYRTEKTFGGVSVVAVQPQSKRWRVSRVIRELRSELQHGKSPITSKPLAKWIAKPMSVSLAPVGWCMSIPDGYSVAISDLIHQARTLHHQDPFCCVLSLYHPFSSHLAARRAAVLHEIPWLAMTKDFYSWPNSLLSRGQSRMINSLKRKYEASVLQAADCVMAVNSNIADYLREVVPGVEVVTLAHCFDETSVPVSSQPSDGVFRLVSVGKVAPTEEPGLCDFFCGLKTLTERKSLDPASLRVRFVGLGGQIVQRCAQKYGCDSFVDIVPQVTHADALRELSQASCLLFQQARWGNRRRLPEYFSVRKPILAFPRFPGTMSQQLLEEYGAAVVAGSSSEITAACSDWLDQFQKDGTIEAEVNQDVVDTFSVRVRSRELESHLIRKIGATVDPPKSVVE